MGNTAAVADDIQAFIAALQIFVDFDLHIVELDFNTIEEGIVIGCAGCDLVEGIDHLDDTVQQTLGQDQAEVAGCSIQCRCDKGFPDAVLIGSAAADEVAKALDNDAAAQHIAQAGNRLAVAVGILKGFREVLGHQQCKVGVAGLAGRIFVAVTVDRDDAVGILIVV